MRLLPAQVAAVGDHVAPDDVMRAPSRLYEFTVGFVSAVMAGAWFRRPAVNESARGESPCISGTPPLHRFLPVPGSCSEMCARARERRERFGHERGAKARALRKSANHVLEEDYTISCHEGVIVVPVDLELTVGVLVVSLVRAPAHRLHVRHQRRYELVAPHERLRVVARLRLHVERIGDGPAAAIKDEELALDARLERDPFLG